MQSSSAALDRRALVRDRKSRRANPPLGSPPRGARARPHACCRIARRYACSERRGVGGRACAAASAQARLATGRAARAERGTPHARRARCAWHQRAPPRSPACRGPGQAPVRKSCTAPRVCGGGKGVCGGRAHPGFGELSMMREKPVATPVSHEHSASAALDQNWHRRGHRSERAARPAAGAARLVTGGHGPMRRRGAHSSMRCKAARAITRAALIRWRDRAPSDRRLICSPRRCPKLATRR
jgi:hypothetical protein